MSLSGFFLAFAALSLTAALLVFLEYRSRPRDRHTSALKEANRGLPDDGKGEG